MWIAYLADFTTEQELTKEQMDAVKDVIGEKYYLYLAYHYIQGLIYFEREGKRATREEEKARYFGHIKTHRARYNKIVERLNHNEYQELEKFFSTIKARDWSNEQAIRVVRWFFEVEASGT
jgi:hypothetical protein